MAPRKRIGVLLENKLCGDLRKFMMEGAIAYESGRSWYRMGCYEW